MSERENENYIGLKFFGFAFPHDLITERLMLTPNKIALKGGTRKGNVLWKESWWLYEEKFVTNEDIADLAEEFILRIVATRLEKIKELSNECYGEIAIAQYYYSGCNPGYHFSKKALPVIVESGLEIDIDTYCMGDIKNEE